MPLKDTLSSLNSTPTKRKTTLFFYWTDTLWLVLEKLTLSSKFKASDSPKAPCRSVPRTSSQTEHCKVMVLLSQTIAKFFISFVLVTSI